MDTIFAECAPRMKSRCLALVEEVVQCPSYKIVARFQSRAPSCVPVCGGGRKCGVKIMGDPCCVRVWGAGDFSCAVRASDAPLNPRSSLERSPTKTRRISTDCLRPSTDRSPHVPKARRRARPSGESTRMIPLRRTCTTASARQVYQARRSDEPESASSAERKRRQFFERGSCVSQGGGCAATLAAPTRIRKGWRSSRTWRACMPASDDAVLRPRD
jgi:hypothetical protein